MGALVQRKAVSVTPFDCGWIGKHGTHCSTRFGLASGESNPEWCLEIYEQCRMIFGDPASSFRAFQGAASQSHNDLAEQKRIGDHGRFLLAKTGLAGLEKRGNCSLAAVC